MIEPIDIQQKPLDPFRAHMHVIYGDANPTRVDFAFWTIMIKHARQDAYWARLRLTGGMFDELTTGAVWCFRRWGRTMTRLSDGRVVFVGGEHEDYYDPDFKIYNDVVVLRPVVGGGRPSHLQLTIPTLVVENGGGEGNEGEGGEDGEEEEGGEEGDEERGEVGAEGEGDEGAEEAEEACEEEEEENTEQQKEGKEEEEDNGLDIFARTDEEEETIQSLLDTHEIEIYIYPRDLFPPTDFHTATLLNDGVRIIIIGSLGYSNERRPGETPVYCLDTRDYRITSIDTTGTKPGWINHHKAEHVESDGKEFIVVSKGRLEPGYTKNTNVWELNVSSFEWRKVE